MAARRIRLRIPELRQNDAMGVIAWARKLKAYLDSIDFCVCDGEGGQDGSTPPDQGSPDPTPADPTRPDPYPVEPISTGGVDSFQIPGNMANCHLVVYAEPVVSGGKILLPPLAPSEWLDVTIVSAEGPFPPGQNYRVDDYTGAVVVSSLGAPGSGYRTVTTMRVWGVGGAGAVGWTQPVQRTVPSSYVAPSAPSDKNPIPPWQPIEPQP